MFIKSEHIYFRALESTDLELLYQCENNPSVWRISNTQTPFSKDTLAQYLEIAHQDIYTNKQLRLLICLLDNNEPIGTVDLFDFEPTHGRVGVGILIFEKFRKNGYAFESIELLKQYAFNTLLVNQLFCNISSSNDKSIALFEKCYFEKIGVKKQWNKISLTLFEDELMYQFIQVIN
jgi:diamine N-acetyltransferase